MPVNIVIAIVAVVLLGLALALAARTWLRMRGARVVTCPENHASAGVEVDAAHAAVTAIYKAPDLRLKSCSRWPEKQDCGQECLQQISATPQECLVRNILAHWYAGQSCIYCGTAFGELDWEFRKPGLLGPDGKLLDWSEVPAEQVFNLLETHKPVCFTCLATNTLVREHPELVVNRTGLR